MEARAAKDVGSRFGVRFLRASRAIIVSGDNRRIRYNSFNYGSIDHAY
jgi:hypothetical protein